MARLFILLLFPTFLLAQVRKPIGINLSRVTDYSTELVFTDAFKQSRAWIPFNADGSGNWDSGVEVPLNEEGYPLVIPYDNGVDPPQSVRSLLLWDLPEEAFPDGRFRLIVEGQGRVGLRFGAGGVYETPVDTLVEASGNVAIEVLASEENDPITSIQFILPAYVNSFEEKIFTDELLEFLDDFQTIRFMDWLRTNNSPVRSWSDRSMADYCRQTTQQGVAWEYIIQLANITTSDLWICIPHRADNNYIMSLATFLQDGLDPGLNIYLEYSNEVWNGIFSQHQESAQMALDLGYTGEEWERAWKYTAKRSADIFRIFDEVFTNDERLVRVIPTQAANAWLSNRILEYYEDDFYNPAQIKADALAIAPYFAGGVADQIVSDGLVSTISQAEILDRMEASLQTSFQWITEQKQISDDHDLDLLVYEGGQHLVATGSNVNIDALTAKLTTANHDPRLQDIYCDYLDHWYEEAGSPFMHFSSHGSYSKWGSWGVKETMGDMDNPKYRALENCVFNSNTVGVGEDQIIDFNKPHVYPNPTMDGVFYIDGVGQDTDFTIYDLLGRSVGYTVETTGDGGIKINIGRKGVFLLSTPGSTIKLVSINN